MKSKSRGAILIAARDRESLRLCQSALEAAGFQTFMAHDSYSAEHALQHHDPDLFVFDAHIFATDPESRPSTILSHVPNLGLVVTNGAVLNRSLRELVTSRDGRILDLRFDPHEVVQAVEELLSRRERPGAPGAAEERELVEASVRRLAHELGERVKELNYLYSMADLTAQEGISLKEILRRLAEGIPAAWQYPEVTCARIIVHGQEFKTDNFRETAWKQSADIVREGKKIGVVEVCYLDERPENAEGPFLREERDLIKAIAQRVGETISHLP